MGISSQSVNAAVFNASEKGQVQGLYFWTDLNLRKMPQRSLVQVLVIKDSHATKSTVTFSTQKLVCCCIFFTTAKDEGCPTDCYDLGS